jgi:hypothetical protein
MSPFPEEIVGGGYTISGAAGDELISPRSEGVMPKFTDGHLWS